MADVNYVAVEGVTLGYSTTFGGAVTLVPSLESVSAPAVNITKVPSWGVGSACQTTRPGRIPELPEVSFKFRWDPSGTVGQALRSAAVAGTLLYWTITYVGDGLTVHAKDQFPAYFVSFPPDAGDGEKNWTVSATLQPTDLFTATPGTP